MGRKKFRDMAFYCPIEKKYYIFELANPVYEKWVVVDFRKKIEPKLFENKISIARCPDYFSEPWQLQYDIVPGIYVRDIEGIDDEICEKCQNTRREKNGK